MKRLCQLLIILLQTGCAQFALAQQRPIHVFADVDVVTTRPHQQAESYSASLTIFQEPATGTVSYPSLSNERTKAFMGGVLFFHGLGAGARFSAAVERPMTSTVSLLLPDPIFFNRFTTLTAQTPLNRTDKAIDVSAVYAIPLGTRFVGARVFAGRSRVEVSEDVVQRFTFTSSRIDTISTQSISAFAWGSHYGIDAEFFPVNNVGVGASVLSRHVGLSGQNDPFSGKPFTMDADRLVTTFGVRARF